MTSSEHIRNTLVAASAAVPIAGGPIAVILDKYLPSELEKRKENLINSLSLDLESIKDSISPARLDSEEYLTTFLKVLRRSLEEHRSEKIVAFRNILVNEALSSSSEFDEITFYIRMIEDLTIDQIRVLQYIYNYQVVGSCSEGADLNIYKEIKEYWPEVDKHYLQACITELIRFFIISSSSEVLKEKGTKGHALTEFGERFVQYIFTPIDMEISHNKD